ncbi:MAG: TonB-dependent receptor [Pirellulales bacterium]|nr:TonB-dependent receptor [Pirellulales bacterium]
MLAVAWSAAAFAQAADAPAGADSPGERPPSADLFDVAGTDDILKLDIEQLGRVDVVVPSLDLPVTTVSRQQSTVGRSPAAVFVITSEMIRRSTARNIPDLLRMVPGLQVARIDANKWAVTSRGFNGRFANKLLVQIDGRTVYTPLFAGVFWDMQDTLLEDIERIEVIRGPGATVWGANAVNGVINIITKDARDTQGAYAQVGGGTEERDFAALRYGGSVGEGFRYRVYGKYFNRDDGYSPLGAFDHWRVGRGGFRMDWDLDRCRVDQLTFQGDYFDGTTGVVNTVPTPAFPYEQTLAEQTPMQGGNLLARWTHTDSEDAGFSLQFYYDHMADRDPNAGYDQDVFDVDFQDRFRLDARQQIVWGLGSRWVRLDSLPTFSLVIDPAIQRRDLYSAFLQDQITLVEDRLLLTAGCKGEHNDFTGFEFQPTARLVWLPGERASAWAAFSRAVRTPSMAESNNGRLLQPPAVSGTPSFPTLWANTDMRSEELLAYELGYRAQPSDAFSWDLALFYNVYDRLRTFNFVNDPMVDPLTFRVGNDMTGETYGVELSWNWKATEHWRLSGYYAFLQMQLHAAQGTAPTDENPEGSSPQNQVYVQSSWDLADDLEFDVSAQYVDSLPSLSIPRYITLDARLAWRPRRHLELAVVGQSLLEGHRPEFTSDLLSTRNTEVQRGVYATATWRH